MAKFTIQQTKNRYFCVDCTKVIDTNLTIWYYLIAINPKKGEIKMSIREVIDMLEAIFRSILEAFGISFEKKEEDAEVTEPEA